MIKIENTAGTSPRSKTARRSSSASTAHTSRTTTQPTNGKWRLATAKEIAREGKGLARWGGVFKYYTISRNRHGFRLAHYQLRFHGEGAWRDLIEERFSEEKLLQIQLSMILKQIIRRKPLPENLRVFRDVKLFIESRAISYTDAISLVREKVLFPAIGAAIPHCMSRDLYALVYTTMGAGRRMARAHVVGSREVTLPPGTELQRDGVLRRKKAA